MYLKKDYYHIILYSKFYYMVKYMEGGDMINKILSYLKKNIFLNINIGSQKISITNTKNS